MKTELFPLDFICFFLHTQATQHIKTQKLPTKIERTDETIYLGGLTINK